MPAQFIDAHHKGLGVTKRLPVTALRSLSGWVPVNPDEVAPDVSASTVAQVLAEVGTDPVKAAAALAAELARPHPRSTLVDALNSIIDEES